MNRRNSFALAAPFLLFCGLWAQSEAHIGIKQLFNVRTVKVERTRSAPQRVNYGYVVPDETRMYEVTPRFGGYVERLYANRRFMKIDKGAPLARVYSAEVLQAKEEYLSALKVGRREMIRSARRRLELLGVAKEEIVRISQKRRVDAQTTIVAPVSGWLFVKRIDEGGAFKAGSALFRIVDLSRVWIEAKIYQRELADLKRYDRFMVRAEGGAIRIPARKKLLYPLIDPKEATATLRLEVENNATAPALIPGMYVRIFRTPKPRSYLTLPRTAVIRKNGRWYAFLTGDFKGEYEPVSIKVRPLDTRRYIVTDGLREGDEVADNALFLLDADAQINGLY